MVKWTRTNPGSARDEGSYYESTCTRFSIYPRFRHTIYPDSYTLSDNASGRDYNYDTIRDCKGRAEKIAAKAEAEDREAKHIADRIDGYDRDDLGESPDY